MPNHFEIVDSHIHVNYKGVSPDNLPNYLAENDTSRCWLLTWEEVGGVRWPYQHLSIADVLAAYARYPTRIIPMYAPDPHRPDAAELFMACYRRGVRGCGELKVSLNWTSPQLQPLLRVLNDLALPLIFHSELGHDSFSFATDNWLDTLIAKASRTQRLGGLPPVLMAFLADYCPPLKQKRATLHYTFPGYMLDFATLEAVLPQYPNIRFIGHGPYFWRGASPSLRRIQEEAPELLFDDACLVCRLLTAYPNLYADLSGPNAYIALTRNRQNALRFLTRFADKLLFGSDNEGQAIKYFLDGLDLGVDIYEQIFGKNARRILNE